MELRRSDLITIAKALSLLMQIKTDATIEEDLLIATVSILDEYPNTNIFEVTPEKV